MRILVTGGAGFIGSNFVHYWHRKYFSDEIVILDKLTYAGHLSNLEGIIDGKAITFIHGDICDELAVSHAMNGIDVVVHFAAESHVDRSITGPRQFVKTNVLGTQILLDAALENNVKLFHHISTDEVFGSLKLKSDEKFSERTPYNPNSPYSASKAGSDHLVHSYFETYGLPVTITNTSNNYGPYQQPEKLIPLFTTNLIDGQKVPLMGEGENVRDWIHVDDHCRAVDMIIKAALRDESNIIGESFCVGADSERNNLQVTLELLYLLNRNVSFIDHVPHRLGHDKRYAIDSTKIRRQLGWRPRHTFEEGLKDTVTWYKNNERWWRPLKEGGIKDKERR